MIGLSFFLSSLVKSQVVVFILLLAYSFLTLVFLGTPLFGLFDAYAFYLPLFFSDFIGLGNINSILPVRMGYLFLGLSLIFVSPLLFRRLKQSNVSNIITGSISIFCLAVALFLGMSTVKDKNADRAFRRQLRESSRGFTVTPTAKVNNYDIRIEHAGETISATVRLDMVNETSAPLDTLLLTLNPGLEIGSVEENGESLDFKRDHHLLLVRPREPVDIEGTLSLNISYSGKIDERYCFLDIDDRRFESQYRLWIYDIPKRYAVITPDFVHLTPESGWYPISGIPSGAAYPAMAAPSYSTYTLAVTAPQGLTVISQGKPQTESREDKIEYTFTPGTLLPKISLTIGSYQHREIEIDGIVYSLYIRPGHDYFLPLLGEVGEGLPELIKQLKDEFEVLVGLNYPYDRLSLVEVPIPIYSYQRLWTVAHETVQPQLVFLPEMGTILAGAEFRIPPQQARRMRQRANQTEAQIQRGLLNRFLRSNLISPQPGARNMMRQNRLGLRFQADIEPQYDLFPNFFSFKAQVVSRNWPVLNYTLESYLRERVAPPMAMFRQAMRGLSAEEETNQDLKSESLVEMIENRDLEASVVQGALQAKSRTLLTRLEARYEGEDFDENILNFIKARQYRIITDRDLTDFFYSLGGIDFAEITDLWYSSNQVPGFILGEPESYDLVEGEKVRTQIKFQIANPTSLGGIVRISLRYRSRGRDTAMRGAGQEDFSEALLIPAQTTVQIGIVSEEPPAALAVDTYVSQNIPSSINVPFQGQREVRDEVPFDGQLSKPYDPSNFMPEGEFIVDNEDAGFEIRSVAKQKWLSRSLQKLFGVGDNEAGFGGVNLFNPPVFWTKTTGQDYYGQLARSAYVKKSGEGADRVIWNVDLDETGEYDIYFFNGLPRGMGRGMMEQRMQMMVQSRGSDQRGRMRRFFRGPGTKSFFIPHQYGTEEVEADLEDAESGWILLGTFQLDAGPNRIELTDQNVAGYVVADAVKWVKR